MIKNSEFFLDTKKYFFYHKPMGQNLIDQAIQTETNPPHLSSQYVEKGGTEWD